MTTRQAINEAVTQLHNAESANDAAWAAFGREPSELNRLAQNVAVRRLRAARNDWAVG